MVKAGATLLVTRDDALTMCLNEVCASLFLDLTDM